MDYTEIIEREAEECSKQCRPFEIECKSAFKDGAEYYKQIAEIEIVKGKIDVLLDENSFHRTLENDWQRVSKKIKYLEHLRDKLINELKLK